MPPPTITYSCVLPEGDGVGAIPVPFDQRALFGRACPPVVVAINAHRYRSTIAVRQGATFVPLSRANREAAGVAAGETITVTLTLDSEPRVVMPPADLADALNAAGLADRWNALSFTLQRELAEGIEGAKRPETRTRRIAAAVATLTGRARDD